MDSKFIELHDSDDMQEEHLVNVKNIVSVHVDDEGVTVVEVSNGNYFLVKETYDDMKKLIQDNGFLINRADPRLDTSHPLTMADLQEMVGDPVWYSNLNVWLLVKDVSDLYAKLVLPSGDVSTWNADEIQKFPLYRMKQDDRPLRERLVDTLREVRGEK